MVMWLKWTAQTKFRNRSFRVPFCNSHFGIFKLEGWPQKLLALVTMASQGQLQLSPWTRQTWIRRWVCPLHGRFHLTADWLIARCRAPPVPMHRMTPVWSSRISNDRLNPCHVNSFAPKMCEGWWLQCAVWAAHPSMMSWQLASSEPP